MSIFVNVDLDERFQGLLLQKTDSQTQCDNFGENVMKMCLNIVGDIHFSLVFHLTHFPPGKRTLSCPHARTSYMTSGHAVVVRMILM